MRLNRELIMKVFFKIPPGAKVLLSPRAEAMIEDILNGNPELFGEEDS